MASLIGATLDNLVSKLSASGYFNEVLTFEPKDAPEGDFTAVVIFQNAQPAPEASGLGVITYSYAFVIRIYRNMLAEPEETTDRQLITILDQVLDDLGGDFDMGATVRNVDLLGEFGPALAGQAGYITISGTSYRTVDITVAFTVNDTVTATQ